MRGLAFSAVPFGLSLLGANANADIASPIEIPTEVRVGNDAQTAYIFKLLEGDRGNPDILLTRGETYSIVAEFGGAHPFYIRNQSDDANAEGVAGQGVAAPGTMTYRDRYDPRPALLRLRFPRGHAWEHLRSECARSRKQKHSAPGTRPAAFCRRRARGRTAQGAVSLKRHARLRLDFVQSF